MLTCTIASLFADDVITLATLRTRVLTLLPQKSTLFVALASSVGARARAPSAAVVFRFPSVQKTLQTLIAQIRFFADSAQSFPDAVAVAVVEVEPSRVKPTIANRSHDQVLWTLIVTQPTIAAL